jgi:hypothetical protein
MYMHGKEKITIQMIFIGHKKLLSIALDIVAWEVMFLCQNATVQMEGE